MTMKVNKELDLKVNSKRIHRIMAENKLLSSVRRKRWTPEQYKKRREMKLDQPRDLLKRNFFSGTPRKIFVADITYLYCIEQMYYLNTILDLFNREIVAWRISNSPNSDLCTKTLIELSTKCDLTDCIIHTDAGTSYLNYQYMDMMKDLNAIASVSIGSCYDNAVEESWNSIFKTEGLYNYFGKTKFKERRIRANEVIDRVLYFIEYYNNERLKKDLNWQTPKERIISNPKGTLPVMYNKQLTRPHGVLI